MKTLFVAEVEKQYSDMSSAVDELSGNLNLLIISSFSHLSLYSFFLHCEETSA